MWRSWQATITQFSQLARDANGNVLPMGGRRIASQTLTAAGAASALDADCEFVRIATDTAYTSDVYGGSDLHPANSVEYFPANGLQVITFTAA